MPIHRTIHPLSLVLLTLGVVPAGTLPAHGSTPAPTLRVVETSWSPLTSGMATVDYTMSLNVVPDLRAVEVRVQSPADPTLHLVVAPQTPSAKVDLFPVKTIETDGSRVFVLVFPARIATAAENAIGTVSCDMPVDAAGPSLSATGLMADGSRTAIAVEFATTTNRHDPPTTIGEHLFLSPNPTRGSVELRYTLKSSGSIDLAVYDLSGRKVASVDLGTRNPGEHRISWDGRDDAGHDVPAGIYFVKLRSRGGITSSQLSIVR